MPGDGWNVKAEGFFEEGANYTAGTESLFALPAKVQAKLVPGLEKIARNFRGEEDEEEKKEKERGNKKSIEVLERKSMRMPELEGTLVCEGEGGEKKEGNLCPDMMAKKYKSIEYLMCVIKHTDNDKYE
jgi:hypothetical protein